MPIDPGNLTLDEILGRLTDEDPVVRLHAALSLGALGASAENALPALRDLLKSGEPRDRKIAVVALGELGWELEEALDLLFDAMGDEDETVSELAARALRAIEGDEAQAA